MEWLIGGVIAIMCFLGLLLARKLVADHTFNEGMERYEKARVERCQKSASK